MYSQKVGAWCGEGTRTEEVMKMPRRSLRKVVWWRTRKLPG